MKKILAYIKKVPRDYVKIIIDKDNVKVVHGYYQKTYDVMTIEEFENEINKA